MMSPFFKDWFDFSHFEPFWKHTIIKSLLKNINKTLVQLFINGPTIFTLISSQPRLLILLTAKKAV